MKLVMIKYRGADKCDGDNLVGNLFYYADAEMALKQHRFVERIETPFHDNISNPYDFLGNLYLIQVR